MIYRTLRFMPVTVKACSWIQTRTNSVQFYNQDIVTEYIIK